MHRSRRFYLTGILLLLSFSGIALTAQAQFGAGSAPDFPDATFRIKGRQNAPIVMVEYSDFECPACRTLQPHLKQVLQEFPGKVALIFRHFPLSAHRYSPLAHQAAECAGEQGQFWAYHDLLYENQDIWKKAEQPAQMILQYAGELKLDSKVFIACLENPEVTATIRKDYESGAKTGMNQTPTVFIGDKMYVGAQQFLEQAIPWIREEAAKHAS